MKIQVLGSGNMSSLNYRNSQFLLKMDSGSNLLFDAGADTKFSLSENKIDLKDIHNIYISHGHSDHIGGLEYLAFMTYFNPTIEKPILIAHHTILRRLWSDALCLGLESLEKRQLKNGEREATLGTYFEPVSIKDNTPFIIDFTSFHPVQTIHIVNGFRFMDSYGLSFKTESGKRVFISADSQFSPSQLKGILEDSDVIFHDCETSPFKSGVHAHYDELVSLPEDIKRKMWLYHYGDNVDTNFRVRATKDGFSGFVNNGEVLEV